MFKNRLQIFYNVQLKRVDTPSGNIIIEEKQCANKKEILGFCRRFKNVRSVNVERVIRESLETKIRTVAGTINSIDIEFID